MGNNGVNDGNIDVKHEVGGSEKYCYRHPKIATKMSCGRCGRPICSDCTMMGSVGVRCPECYYGVNTSAANIVEDNDVNSFALIIAAVSGIAIFAVIYFLSVKFHGVAIGYNALFAVLYGMIIGIVIRAKSGKRNISAAKWGMLYVSIGSVIIGVVLTIIFGTSEYFLRNVLFNTLAQIILGCVMVYLFGMRK